VRRRVVDEVDNDAGLLARVDAHDPPDSLLVDAPTGRRREVHADGRARRVPALGEELGVDEHVDLASLVGRKRLGELERRRASADRLGLEPGGAELTREVVGVLHPRGVDDPGGVVEPVAVEARGCLVDQLVVEDLGQDLLVVVAADDRHRRDGCGRPHTKTANRRYQAPTGGVAERELVDRGREDVGDLLGDQLLGRRHADVDRLREAADGRARLLAQGGMRLVADDELVGGAAERADVPREPRVGLDRDRIAVQRLLALFDLGHDPVAVPLGLELSVELGDQQPAVREDEDPHRARRLDEPRRGNGLARGSRVAETEAAGGAGILGGRRLLFLGELLVELLLLELGFERLAIPVLRRLLQARDELGEHSRERVDLMTAQLRSGDEARGVIGQDALEAEHERVPNLPVRGGASPSRVHLGQRIVERAPAGPALGKGFGRILVGAQEGLAGPCSCPKGCGC
jgi:hypothetical protein